MHTFQANSSRRIITLYVTRAVITPVLVLLMQAKAQFLLHIDARTLQGADKFWGYLTMDMSLDDDDRLKALWDIV